MKTGYSIIRLFLTLAIVAVCISAPAAAVTSAQDSCPEPKGILTISFEGNTTWVRNFGPFASGSLYPTFYGIYEPLFIYNYIRGEMVPWLGTEYSWSDDNLSLSIMTREGVSWSDGEPFTANDVAYTFNLLNTLFGSVGMWSYLTKVEAVSDTQVDFSFNRVYTPAIYDIGGQIIVPEHIWKDVEDPLTFTNPDPVATGPFTEIAEFKDQVYEIHRNPNYWQPCKPYIQGIRLPAYASNDAAVLATVNGDNDWGNQFIPDIETTFVAKDPENNHYWFPPTVVVPLYVNTTRKPFDDPNVRKALSMAINRAQVVAIGMNGYANAVDGTGLSDVYQAWKDPELVNAEWVTYDPDKANALLDEAGYPRGTDGIRTMPDGTPMRFEIIAVPASTDMVASSQIMTTNFKDIGLDVTLATFEGPTWYDKLSRGEFDMSMAWTNGGATPFEYYRGLMSTSTVQPVGTSAGENWGRFGDPTATDLVEAFAATSDEQEHRRIITELQHRFAELVPTLPLYSGPAWMEYSTRRFVGWPNADDPYAVGQPSANERLIVLTTVRPKE
ncbi:MAG: ABC transporter substrate-binding protein [Anaerolineae bacterium]|nr:ABC transporter substrate-binding protein [Anaerolineae bacterium]